jgi:transposase
MSTIIKSKSGNNVYLYESESYRENGKVRNRRRIVGKVDPVTGEHIYKPEYLEEKGLVTFDNSATAHNQRVYSVNDVKKSRVTEYGVFRLLDEITKQIGLADMLASTIPTAYNEILNLAFFIVASGEPALYCEDWLYKSEHYPSKALSSQRISELLLCLTAGERNAFFESWSDHRRENEYIALDITSISTYSEQIIDAEWGYNRDKEKLPQINICLLLGEKSRLPILQVVYSGSLKDVSTLKNTLQTAYNLNLDDMSVVMDKGFASNKNIKVMLAPDSKLRFLIALPFNMSFPKKQVESEHGNIDCVENTIIVGEDVIRGITKVRSWEDYDIFAHTYLNSDEATRAKNRLYAKVQRLIDQVKLDPATTINNLDVKKYLIVRKSAKEQIGFTINIRHEVVQKELMNSGWLVLVSNHVDNAREAILIYRGKDVVEKGFQYMKNCLDLARLRVHSDNAMQNKIFICFIALILTAHIHNVMFRNELYEKWTMKKMLKILERMKAHYIKNDKIISPLTKDQKRIFHAFNIKSDL